MATEFTPVSALLGGVLIGAASAGFYLVNGRIAGISGLLREVLLPHASRAWSESVTFLAGLVLAPFIWAAVVPWPIVTRPTGDTALLITAGLLTGVGTALANGCTSGHGVCGLARLSLRSLVAVVTFMAVAGLTVFFTRHGIPGGS